jgi:DnaJ like chaperone protein
MSIWTRLAELLNTVAAGALSALVEAVRSVFSGDPETRRRVAFSVALIALSAKMAKADGVVSYEEVRAFQEIFHVPDEEARNVARLYDLAKRDVAGFEIYAGKLASLCGGDAECAASLEDVLDGLFHIAKADGIIHERELAFLQTAASIFSIEEKRFQSILSRHAVTGAADPYAVLGISRGTPFADAQRIWRELVKENHPDLIEARGVPKEFLVIADERIKAINAAWNILSPELKRAVLVQG